MCPWDPSVKTVSACFAVLCLLWSICRSGTRPVFQLLVAALALSQLDYGNVTVAGIPSCLVQQWTPSLSWSTCLWDTNTSPHCYVNSTSRNSTVYRLQAGHRYKCLHLDTNVCTDLQKPISLMSSTWTSGCHHCLQSAASSLIFHRMHLTIVGDQTFLFAATSTWNSLLPPRVTLAPFVPVFRVPLKTLLTVLSVTVHCPCNS